MPSFIVFGNQTFVLLGGVSVQLVPGVPTFVPQNPEPAFDTGVSVPLNLPTFYSPPLNFQAD